MSFINIENIQYNGFENMCRTCMDTCNLKPLQDNVIIQVLHNLTGDLFEINDELPQQICIECFNKLQKINAFASQCKQSHMHLRECLNNFKKNSIKIEIKEEIIKEPYAEVGLLENALRQTEFVKIETETSNVYMEELHLKSENIDEPSSINAQEHEEDPLNDCHEGPSAKENKCADRPSTCETSKSFLTPNALENHKKTHIERIFECDVCKRVWPTLKDLRRHSLVHSDNRPYVCETCNKSFKSSSCLTQHRAIHLEVRRHKCDVCTKTFVQSGNLIRHKKIHTGERSHSCDICSKKFIDSGKLKKHMRTHTGERPYHCDQCDKSFTQLNTLVLHKRWHNGERPNQCEICFKNFIHKTSLARHMPSHGKERTFKCDVCTKSYVGIYKLRLHQRLHTGEKPFKCDVCNKAFVRSDTLRTHQKIHIKK